ncbi:hypothetical protein C8J57DRAFT_1503432 [Mycena rebaudengoi]|nr:hypothetical protein C8J57DRAFT_1503432 [Mycena rebaudengoi]
MSSSPHGSTLSGTRYSSPPSASFRTIHITARHDHDAEPCYALTAATAGRNTLRMADGWDARPIAHNRTPRSPPLHTRPSRFSRTSASDDESTLAPRVPLRCPRFSHTRGMLRQHAPSRPMNRLMFLPHVQWPNSHPRPASPFDLYLQHTLLYTRPTNQSARPDFLPRIRCAARLANCRAQRRMVRRWEGRLFGWDGEEWVASASTRGTSSLRIDASSVVLLLPRDISAIAVVLSAAYPFRQSHDIGTVASLLRSIIHEYRITLSVPRWLLPVSTAAARPSPLAVVLISRERRPSTYNSPCCTPRLARISLSGLDLSARLEAGLLSVLLRPAPLDLRPSVRGGCMHCFSEMTWSWRDVTTYYILLHSADLAEVSVRLGPSRLFGLPVRQLVLPILQASQCLSTEKFQVIPRPKLESLTTQPTDLSQIIAEAGPSTFHTIQFNPSASPIYF